MKKIGIITPNGYYNYGNRLQNYALQESLKTFDYDVETLIVRCTKPVCSETIDEEVEESSFLRRVIDRPMHENIKILVKLVKRVLNKRKAAKQREIIAEASTKRQAIFIQFSKHYINEKDYSITGVDFPAELVDRFSYFVVGSDQVWNPFYHWGMTPTYWLDFAPKNKRLSYAASFGVESIPAEYKDIYCSYLNNMQTLSIRENEGAKIVTELTGRDDVYVHVDPIMLLTKQQWMGISKCHVNKPSGKYILTYFLGTISDEVDSQIKLTAKRLGTEIVNLAMEGDLKAYITDPAEFLDYINGAELFYTDSFHGCAFSIIFQTYFVVCYRTGSDTNQSMLSRIDTLLTLFGLESRKFGNLKSLENIKSIDFSKSSVVLKKERERSFSYLKAILK